MRIRDAGELVTALPTFLGFHPRSSLVLAAMGGPSGRQLGLVVRCNLPDPGPDPGPDVGPDASDRPRETAAAVVGHAVAGLLRDHPVAAAIVLVAQQPSADPAQGPPWRAMAELAVERLTRLGIDVHAAVWASGTATGDRWACYGECGCSGTVSDPSSTPFAMSAATDGMVVYADRAELLRLVAPADPSAIRRRERLLSWIVEAAAESGEPPAGIDPAAGVALVEAALVEAALAEAAAGGLTLDDQRVVALATALTEPEVRDEAVAAAAAHGGSGAGAAAREQLWAALARETPDPEAAEPAALLAVCALLRGDGALANVALDRAEQAWPGHRLARLLRAVTELGLRPEEFRAAIMDGAGGDG